MKSLNPMRQARMIAPIIIGSVPTTLAQEQFQTFFPGWSDLITNILEVNCSQDVEKFAKDPMGQARWDVVDCILGVFSESRKAEGVAAALTFGLAPMVLQNIGPSTSETSLLFLRRPFLALLLAISSPWPSNPNSTKYDNPLYGLSQPIGLPMWPDIENRPRRVVASFVSLFEYALAMGAAANVASLAYQLGHWSFFSSANNVYDPVLWTYNALLIHIVGIIGIFLRVRVLDRHRNSHNAIEEREQTWLPLWLADELTPTAYNDNLRLEPRDSHLPSVLSLLIAWVLSIAPTLQVLMGTIMLSGSLLTSQADARNCLFRYVGSAIVARALLWYELAGLRQATSGVASVSYTPAGSTIELMDQGHSAETRQPSKSVGVSS
ncbi:hypothetical protein CkaCkLH20_07701 [Colletotrichum karsti]|uniref:Uncharacterized protein n=1 Tax=Colletotrichum karsti TaxID=1095194 RepID=A0A9P6I122_9PEZI|nr:uncharacterized protein CkaCkLH20_07701 [Colletotrichum karsti]KAF9875007.1 hypothetical protein CkaCkLH20_07701 [Colletotrichum karsti]